MLVCFLTACSDDTKDELPVGSYDASYNLYIVTDSVEPNYNTDFSAPFNATEKRINSRMNDFAVNSLIDYSSDNSENLMISPVSLSIVYSMMSDYVGDKDNNAYKENLGINDFMNGDIRSYCCKLINQSNNLGLQNKAEYGISNSLWIQEQTPVYRSFVESSKSYKVNIKGINLNQQNSLERINQAIQGQTYSDQTGISKIYDKNATSLVTSTFKFKNEWKEQFGIDSSHKEAFANVDGTEYKCDFLYSQRNTNYASFQNFDMVEIPYKEGQFSMYIVLPHDADKLNQALSELQRNGLENCMNKMTRNNVNILLPKFKYSVSTSMANHNQKAMAVVKKMYQTNLPKVSPQGFMVGDMFQSSTLEITESGVMTQTEVVSDFHGGAQPGFLGATPGGSDKPSSTVIDFVVNHPFVLFIRNTEQDVISFACCIKSLKD